VAAAAAGRRDQGHGHDRPGAHLASHHQPDPGHRPAGPPGVEAVVDLAAGAGAVWAVTGGAGLLRIDPRTARLTASLPGPVSAVAAGAGGVWAVCCQGRIRRGRVTRLDPTSGRVIAAVGLPARPLAVGAGPGGVWIRGAEGWLWRVDPAGDRQAGAIRLPTVPGSAELGGEVVVAGEVLWASDP
jgi:hypothetical protein